MHDPLAAHPVSLIRSLTRTDANSHPNWAAHRRPVCRSGGISTTDGTDQGVVGAAPPDSSAGGSNERLSHPERQACRRVRCGRIHRSGRRAAVQRRRRRSLLAGRTKSSLDAVTRQITDSGGRASYAVVDTLDDDAVDSYLSEVAGQAGRIDIEFNATGPASRRTVPARRPPSCPSTSSWSPRTC